MRVGCRLEGSKVEKAYLENWVAAELVQFWIHRRCSSLFSGEADAEWLCAGQDKQVPFLV